jgi:hypothetical protein
MLLLLLLLEMQPYLTQYSPLWVRQAAAQPAPLRAWLAMGLALRLPELAWLLLLLLELA